MNTYPNEHAGFPSLDPPKKEQAPAPKEEPKQAEPCANACINPNCKKVCEGEK